MKKIILAGVIILLSFLLKTFLHPQLSSHPERSEHDADNTMEQLYTYIGTVHQNFFLEHHRQPHDLTELDTQNAIARIKKQEAKEDSINREFSLIIPDEDKHLLMAVAKTTPLMCLFHLESFDNAKSYGMIGECYSHGILVRDYNPRHDPFPNQNNKNN